MLLARGHTTIGSADLRWAVAFAGKFWSVVVERSGLTLDTRHVAPTESKAKPNSCLYLLVNGAWRSEAVTFEGPTAFVVSEEQLDGGEGKRSLWFRAKGLPYLAIELHFPAADLKPPVQPVPVAIELDAETWDAAKRAASISAHDDPTFTAAMSDLIGRLGAAGILDPAAAASAIKPTSAPFARLWSALRPMVERLYLAPTIQQVSQGTGLSERQVDRHVRDFVSAFGLIGAGWRAATRHLRLKLSVLLLSAESASIADIARIVGYGSSDAMARAYRDAGMEAPSVIQEKVRVDD